MSSLLEVAFDPQQYDSGSVFWINETGLHSPTRKFFYDFLSRYRNLWHNADILDVGCGTGWLLELMLQEGARSVEGFDPSHKSIELGIKLFPHIQLRQCDVENFQSHKQYDLIVSVMAFGHIRNPENALQKLNKCLKESGEIHLTIPAYEYFRHQRHNYVVEIEDLNAEEYLTCVKRTHWGVITEVVRQTNVYKRAAEKAGLCCVEEVPMRVTQTLIKMAPRYERVKDKILTHLLRFQKA